MNMLFGKKENKAELPDLPPLPPLPPKEKPAESTGMPEFPDSPEKRQSYEGMQGMIQPPGRKDAFLTGPQPMEEKKIKVVEMEEWHPKAPQYNISTPVFKEPPVQEEEEYEMGLPEVPHLPRISEAESEEKQGIPQRPSELDHLPSPKRMYVQNKPVPRMAIQPQQVADVFVRIDKFHLARKSLSEIQNRLDDIDELIRRIRDTKLKEEQELAGWEKDLMQIRGKVQTVAENIFEKVE
jgi:hypothetical protein